MSQPLQVSPALTQPHQHEATPQRRVQGPTLLKVMQHGQRNAQLRHFLRLERAESPVVEGALARVVGDAAATVSPTVLQV